MFQKCMKDGSTPREEQCGRYNNIPFRGSLYSWIPAHKPQTPCALICRSAVTEDKVTVKLNDTVDDGTACGNNSVCIAGKCLVSESNMCKSMVKSSLLYLI